MHLLTPEEWVVASYVCRHILGWQDSNSSRENEISLTMIERGFTAKTTGERYHGCGLARPTIVKALDALAKFCVLMKIGKATNSGQRWRIPDNDAHVDYDGLKSRLEEKTNQGRKRTKTARTTLKTKRASGQSDKPPQVVNPTNQKQLVPLTTGGKSDLLKQIHIKNNTNKTPAQSADEKPSTNDSRPDDFFVKQSGVAIQADSYADAQRIAEKGGTITQRQALKDELIEKNKQGLLFQAWVEELGKDTLPAAFAYKPYMRFMLQLVKDGYEPPDLTCAASLYKAWLKAHPGRVSIDWAVGAVTTAIRRALDLCKSGICAEDVSAFVTGRYAEVDSKGNRFWAGKLVKFDHVAENVANWKAENAPEKPVEMERVTYPDGTYTLRPKS